MRLVVRSRNAGQLAKIFEGHVQLGDFRALALDRELKRFEFLFRNDPWNASDDFLFSSELELHVRQFGFFLEQRSPRLIVIGQCALCLIFAQAGLPRQFGHFRVQRRLRHCQVVAQPLKPRLRGQVLHGRE